MDDSGTQHIFRSTFILCKVKSDLQESAFWGDNTFLGGDECTSVGQIEGSSSDFFILPAHGASDNNPPTFELSSLLPLHSFTMIY